MHEREVFVAIAAAFVGVTILAVAGLVGPADAAQDPFVPSSMFGFDVGEERRYVLGPPDVLLPGESVLWTIELAEVTENRGRRYAAFDLGLESRELGGPTFEETFARSLRARLIVNDAGFPGMLTVYELMNDTTLVSTYSLQEDGEYEMVIRWPGDTYTFPVPVPRHPGLDLDGQRGLFLYTNGNTLGGGRRPGIGHNLFSNPGLLALATPSPLPESGWEYEFLAFSPADAIPRYPNATLLRALGNGLQARTSNLHRMGLRTRGSEQVEVGGRTVDAVRIDVRGPYLRAFADRDGRLLLLELEGSRKYHVRLLWPSEY